jgi:hypothetical protein
MVDGYTGAGRTFIAIRRAPGAPAGAVGVHFTLPGDQRVLPLRFARLGAGPRVLVTAFVAAREIAGPALPFAALTLFDLPAGLLREKRYADAVFEAVAAHQSRAFVAEGSGQTVDLLITNHAIGPRLAALTRSKQFLSRLTTVVAADQLTTDVELSLPLPGPTERLRYVDAGDRRGPGGLSALAAVAVGFRLRRRHRKNVRPSGSCSWRIP